MKTAVEEIREALSLACDDATGEYGYRGSRYELYSAARTRLDELEQQIAEAEVRGRDEAFGVLRVLRESLPTLSEGLRHHAFKAREALRGVERAICHYDQRAAERAKGGDGR